MQAITPEGHCLLCTRYPHLVHRHDDDTRGAVVWIVPSSREPGTAYEVHLLLDCWWSCSCRWGASPNTTGKCWHAQLVEVLERAHHRTARPSPLPQEDREALMLRYLRALHGEQEDQLLILQRAALAAFLASDRSEYTRINRLVLKWFTATSARTRDAA